MILNKNENFIKKMSESRRYDAISSGDASSIVGKRPSFFEAVKGVAQFVLTEEVRAGDVFV